MFPETATHVSEPDESTFELDPQQSKELDRYISKKKKKKIVIHSLLHNRCKFCISSFSSTNCRNCCLPICQEFSQPGTKKLLKNTAHNIKTGHGRDFVKKYSKSVGHLGLTSHESFLDTPPSTSSPKLSPSLSARNLVTSRPASNNSSATFASTRSDSPASPPNTLSTDKMILRYENEPVQVESEYQQVNPTMPSAPSLGHMLFNNEEQSDVVFLVGTDKNKQWRFPAHTTIVANSSQFFSELVYGQDDNVFQCTTTNNNNNTREIRIPWCDPATFHIILKYIYTGEVVIKSVSGALSLFNASNSFFLLSLSKLCLTFLFNYCSDENALEILTFFNNYFKIFYYKKTSQANTDLIENLVDIVERLIEKCYAIIDYDADKIITSEDFVNLSRDVVEKILQRDTLNLRSELEVYESICQWACQQCKKERKELTDRNKRQILQDMIFYPRYLTMTAEEFLKGPNNHEILNQEEKTNLLSNLESSGSVELLKHMQGFKMDVKRRHEDFDGNSFTDERISMTEDKPINDIKFNKEENINKEPTKQKQKKSMTRRIMKRIGNIMILIIRVLD